MGFNFIAAERDQPFLLPPDVREWLPADHLAWFIDVVDHLDLASPLRGMDRTPVPTRPGLPSTPPHPTTDQIAKLQQEADRLQQTMSRHIAHDVVGYLFHAQVPLDAASPQRTGRPLSGLSE